MKILLFTIFALFIAVSVYAIDITFRWDTNTEPNIAGYRLYRATQSGGSYSLVADEIPHNSAYNTTEYTKTNVQNRVYYWVVTAYDTEGLESDYSNEVFNDISEEDTTPPTNPIIRLAGELFNVIKEMIINVTRKNLG